MPINFSSSMGGQLIRKEIRNFVDKETSSCDVDLFKGSSY